MIVAWECLILMNYYVVFGAPFLLLLLPLSVMFGSYIGHLNHALWKSCSDHPKIKLKGLWRILIPMGGVIGSGWVMKTKTLGIK